MEKDKKIAELKQLLKKSLEEVKLLENVIENDREGEMLLDF